MADLKNKGLSPIIPPKSLPSNTEAHVVVALKLSKKISALHQLNLNFVTEEPSPIYYKLFFRTINNIRSCLKTFLQNNKKKVNSHTSITPKSDQVADEKINEVISRFMERFENQNKMWCSQMEETNAKWQEDFIETNNNWEKVIRERDRVILSLQEDLKSKDETLKNLRERCATRIRRNSKEESKTKKDFQVDKKTQKSQLVETSGKEDVRMEKPRKKKPPPESN